jgi:hypothetical protein
VKISQEHVMSHRFNNATFDVVGSSVSVLEPSDEDYVADAQAYGVPNPDGRWIVGVGPDHPDVVLVGTREQLVAVATEMLIKLGAR